MERKSRKPKPERGGCEEDSVGAAGTSQEGRGSAGNHVTISQKRPGESQIGAVSFQRNLPPQWLPRNETPFFFFFFFLGKNEIGSRHRDPMRTFPSQ